MAIKTKIYVLHFPKETGDQPMICQLIKRFDLDFNILKATILPGNDGLMVIELSGQKDNVNEGIRALKDMQVKIEAITTIVRRDEDKCFECGACTGVCPTKALFIRRPLMNVIFEPNLCTGCGLCVPVCPVQAMVVNSEDALSKLS